MRFIKVWQSIEVSGGASAGSLWQAVQRIEPVGSKKRETRGERPVWIDMGASEIGRLERRRPARYAEEGG